MASTAPSLPTPISVSTSQAWDNDGAGEWSTFIVNVGTPAQPAKVLVSTVGYSTWVVVGEGCPDDPKYPTDCASARGNVLAVENSTSWLDIGIFSLELEAGLGLNGNGMFGRDTVTLGYTGSGGPTLKNQIVAGIASEDYWLGTFGIDPVPANFSTLNDPQPSYLRNLRNQSMIPSTSWGYTAGAAYREDKVQGSLTLGGYDSSRFTEKNITLEFYNDIQRRYTVGVNSIVSVQTGLATSTSPVTLMPQRISMLIDSTTPYIWLPESACDRFASSFGLKYDSTNEIYTMNDTMHSQLQKTKPEITFTISNTGGETLDIVIPYDAFDVKASFPVTQNETNYFPIKRANSTTQYTLGRTFLQEAYLIADHDRSEFTIAPCRWPPATPANIKAIYPPGTIVPTNTTITPVDKPPQPSRIPLGAIIGGVVGGIGALLLAALAFWIFYWRPRRRKKATKLTNSSSSASASSDNARYPADPQHGGAMEHAYKHGDPRSPELDGMYAGAELPDIYSLERTKTGELQGSTMRTPMHEMSTGEAVGSELETREVYEMAAREPVATELSSTVDPKVPGRRGKEGKKHKTYYNP